MRSRLHSLVRAIAVAGALHLGTGVEAVEAQTFTLANSPDLAATVGFPTGATWVDFDEDGDLDLYVVTGFDPSLDNLLFRNDAGTFVRVTASPLAMDHADTPCSAWADFDNDGHIDVFVSNLGAADGVLYAGQGGGAFAPVAGALPAVLKGAGCAWGDYDQDGHVDLVVASIFGQLGMNTASRLFHNDGDGTFTEVTSGPIAATTDSHHHPTWADFDGDGDLDLFFATGPVGSLDTDRMYRNRRVETGTATFEAITTGVFATDPRDSQTLQWIDFDQDGDLDLFAVNYTTVPCQLYRNDGGGAWTKVVAGSLVTDLGRAHDATWGDFDNDGDLDVYVVTDLSQSNRYYRNDGGGGFTRITTGAFVNEARSNYGVAAGDYDADGDLDLFVPTARREGPSALYRNDTANGNHWIEIVLTGSISNRSAIGAKVRVRAVVSGAPRWQLREVRAGTGYGGHDALDVHIGLADATMVDSLVIEWPSGLRQVMTGVAADRRLAITEDVATAVAASLVSARAEPDRVEIVWRLAPPPHGDVTLERREAAGPWRDRGVCPVEAGLVRARDGEVRSDVVYGYRLAVEDGARRVHTGELEIRVPARPALSLAIAGGIPVEGPLRARVELGTPAAVTLEVFDLAGRPLARRTLDLEAGRHEVALAASGALPAGLYLVRLTHPEGRRAIRAVVLE